MSERLERNRKVIEEFRANEGRVGGEFEGIPLVLLSTVGARTGQRRTMPLAYLPDGDRPVVFAANGGRSELPGWYHNLLSQPEVEVEVAAERYRARAVELAGEERESAWDRQVERLPFLADFAERAGRVVPVVALERLDG